LVTSEIGKDVPNPVAVEGVEGDQEKPGDKDDEDEDQPTTGALEGSLPSGDKENPVVVDVRLSMYLLRLETSEKKLIALHVAVSRMKTIMRSWMMRKKKTTRTTRTRMKIQRKRRTTRLDLLRFTT
jgi:hypothetical protein